MGEYVLKMTLTRLLTKDLNLSKIRGFLLKEGGIMTIQKIKNIFLRRDFSVPEELKKYICSHDELMKKTKNLNLSCMAMQLRRNGHDKKG
jgi:hypothetical protein